MAEPQKIQSVPTLPPPQTRIVDESGRMTKEFYDYLLRLNATISAQGALQRKAL